MKNIFSKQKFILCVLLSLMLIASINHPIFAASAKHETNSVIRVGYSGNGQMIQKIENGYTGYGAAYLNKLSEYTGWKYEYIEVNEEERIRDLMNGTIDLLCDVSEDETGADNLILSEENTSMNFALLCAKADNTDIFFNDYEAIDGKRVALNTSRKMEHFMEEFAADFDLSYTPVYCKNIFEMMEAVDDGRADLLVSSNQRKLDGYKYVAKIGIRNQYFATSPQHPELMDRINFADRQMKLQHPFMIASLYDIYFGRPSDTLIGITREEYEFVESTPEIRVLCDGDNYPTDYFDADTGEYHGIYADAMKLISAKSGLKFKFIPVPENTTSWDMLKNREAEMSIAMYMNNSLQEEYGFLTATPYMNEKYTLIARTGQTPEGNFKIAVPKSYIGIQSYAKHEFPDCQVVSCKNNEECLEATNSGSVDATLISSVTLQTVFNLNNYPDLVSLPLHSVDLPLCNAFYGPDAGLLCEIVDKAIRQIPENQFEECINANTVKTVYEPTLREISRKAAPAFLIIIAAILLGSLLTVKSKERHFRMLSRTDIVTSIWNGRYFRTRASEILSQNNQNDYQLLSFDLEHFKLVNMDYGQKTADVVLKVIARRANELFGENALCAREMSDRFLVLTEPRSDIEDIICQLGSDISIKLNDLQHYYHPDIKCGICNISRQNPLLPLNSYIDCAVAARKSIKGNTHLKIAYFDEAMAENLSHKSWVEKHMENALNEHEFVVYYQPKYNLCSDKLSGAEALVRWNNPEKGMLFPNSFIPIFEQNGFIIQMDFFVYEEALKMISTLRKEKHCDLVISVNVSRAHIETHDFLTKLIHLTDKYQVPRHLLELELTETVIGSKSQNVIDFIWKCRNEGFSISIDDFGSGYSSLNLLRELPVNILKIDREFLNETEVSEKSSIIIEEIVQMAARLNIRTLCEGVETNEQAGFLKRIGCNMAQGYLYSKPLPSDHFAHLIEIE